MKICLIYSGWLRTYDRCRQNHADNLIIPGDVCVVDYNENTADLTPYPREMFEHYRENKAPETEPENTMSMWRGMYKAWQGAPNDCACYVRCRYDIIFSGPIRFEDYEMKPDVVYIPTGQDFREGVNDQFAFGSREAMKAYYSVFLDHETHFAAGKMFHSESYLKHTLDMRGIQIVRIPQTNTIIR